MRSRVILLGCSLLLPALTNQAPARQEEKPAAAPPAAEAKPVAPEPAPTIPADPAKPADAKPADPAKAAEPAKVAEPAAEAKPEVKVEAMLLEDASAVKIEADPLPDFPAAQEAKKKEDEAKTVAKVGVALLPEKSRLAFANFTSKLAVLRHKELDPEMEKTVAEMKEKGKMDAAATAKLTALGKEAVKEAVEIWLDKFAERYAPNLAQSDDVEDVLSNWNPEQFASSNNLILSPAPTETRVWKDGLKNVLSPENYAAVEEESKKEKKQILEDMANLLADAESRASEVINRTMESELEQLLHYTEIDEARQKELRAASEAAVKETVGEWRKRAEGKLLEMDPKLLKQMNARNNEIGVDFSDEKNKPQTKAVWVDAGKKLLTSAETDAIAAGRENSKNRRAEALALMILGEMDRLVGFNQTQREQLLALSTPLTQKLPNEFFVSAGTSYSYLDASRVLSKVKEIGDTDLERVLDAGQVKRWKAASSEQLINNRVYSRNATSTGVEKPETEMDEIDAERMISKLLDQEAGKLRQKTLTLMEAKLEQIVRVTTLDEAKATVLKTAAKGAAEQLSKAGVVSMDQYIRNQLRSVKPADVPARLKSISVPNNIERRVPEDPKIWTAAVKRLLTEEQNKLWDAESEARREFRLRGLAGLVATEVGKHVFLTPEKDELLRRKMVKVIDEYEDDISNFLSYGWYLQSYYGPVPVALLTDKEMKQIFTAKQIETVKTRGLGNAVQYAEIIKQRHKSRKKTQRQ
ncbi:MAG: hypothetical protein JWL81_1225 [Verrucomicrobiales bacterium]|nr:hypothetical protein [Verrucomicrobiales bacterium]